MTLMKWRDAHVSGKAGSTLDQWNGVGERLIPQGVKAFACTEFGQVKRMSLPKGWGQHSPAKVPGADGFIAWDGDEFRQRPIAKGVEVLTERNYGARKGVAMHWVLLRHHATGGTLLRWVAHWPAHVQRGNALRSGRIPVRDRNAVSAWLEVERNTPKVLANFVARYGPDTMVGSCDFNVDLLRPAWIKRLNGEFGAVCQHVLAPTEGTHGPRAIDGYLTDARRQRVKPGAKARADVAVLPKRISGFDHHIVMADLLSPVA